MPWDYALRTAHDLARGLALLGRWHVGRCHAVRPCLLALRWFHSEKRPKATRPA